MIATEEATRQAIRDTYADDESGSHQRMVALLVETRDLKVGPDPILEKADRDTLAELESILYSL